MKPVLKWLARCLVVVLILILGCTGILLFSTQGVNLVLWGAQKALPTLKVEKVEGQLLDGLSLTGVDFTLPGIDIKAKTLFNRH